MRSAFRRSLRSISTLLVLVFTWNGLAHAAKPSTKLALLQASAPTTGTASAGTPQATAPASGASAHDRLVAAHTVFLADPTIDTHFAADRTGIYNAVLDALNQWGRYRLVNSASRADLILQIHGRSTEVDTPGTPPDDTPSVTFYSHLDLTLAEPNGLAPVWKVSIPLQDAARHKARAVNLAAAGENAVSSLKIAAGDPLTRQDRAALKTLHDAHNRALLFGLSGIGLAVGLAVIGISLARKNSRDFCQQHNLSPCPGA